MLLIDINPNNAQTLVISASNVELVSSVTAPHSTLAGSGHAPTVADQDWLPGISSFVFSGSSAYTDIAKQYLYNEGNDEVFNQIFGCTNSTWVAWDIFVVTQLSEVPITEATILSINQEPPQSFSGGAMNAYPNVLVYVSPSSFDVAVYSDNVGSSNGIALGNVDLNAHVIEFYADGAGGVSGSFDGTPVAGVGDVRPKTVQNMTIGATWYVPRFALEQVNGSIARVLVFDTNLSPAERTKVTNMLGSMYGIGV